MIFVLVTLLGSVFGALSWAAHAATGRHGYVARTGIAYGDDPAQKLDVFMPKVAAPGGPVMVFFYGGSWDSGSRRNYRFVGKVFAGAGVTVVIPDYRRYPETIFPGFVEDGARVVAWAWQNIAKEQRGRLFVAGHSAGAHIAMLLNLDEHYLATAGVPKGAVAGAIGLSGPYDFLPLKEARYKAIFPEATRDASQPINFVDGGEPPMLLATGEADKTVGPGNTARLADKIRARGGTVTVKLYPGVRHVGTMAALVPLLPYRKPPVREDVLAFIAAVGCP